MYHLWSEEFLKPILFYFFLSPWLDDNDGAAKDDFHTDFSPYEDPQFYDMPRKYPVCTATYRQGHTCTPETVTDFLHLPPPILPTPILVSFSLMIYSAADKKCKYL